MRRPGAERRRALAFTLAFLSIVAGLLAIWAQATGGFRIHLLGLPLSVRGAPRPTVVSLILGAAALHLFGAWRSKALSSAIRLIPRAAPWAGAAAALWTLVAGIVYGSTVAAASDPSGYVSQAALWLKGALNVPQPDVGPLPWPQPEWTFSPLGYRPNPLGHTLVPTYAPGLPLLMAGARLVAGVCGPYLVTPICAALLVWATYLIGARFSGRAVGAIAAIAVSVSPSVVFMMLQPMSDVPNAAFWTLSLLFAGRSARPGDALLAGLTAGIAVLIRPNLAPLAIAPALLTLWLSDNRGAREVLRRGAMFAAGCLPFVLLVAVIFNHLYGSPLRSGYGSLEDTYALANAPVNLARYPEWFLETQGPAALAFLLAPLVPLLAADRRRVERWVFLGFIGGVLGGYVFYLSFVEWWYLRFVLPAFPFVFILGGDAVAALAGKIGPVARGVALTVFAAAVISTAATESAARDVMGVARSERRYADAADYVQRALPRGAVVMTMQHSGSVSYYTDKLPLRYDSVAPEWIDRAIELFRASGRPVYALLDDWEVPVFAERFKGQLAAGVVGMQPIAATPDGRVLLFATGTPGSGGSPVMMPGTKGCLPPADD